MPREQLWKALAEASDAVAAATYDCLQGSTQSRRNCAESAIRAYVDLLGPVIGHRLAVRYHVSYQSAIVAIDRLSGLMATLAARSTTNDADVAMTSALGEAQAAALDELERVQAEVDAALDQAAERDRTAD